MLYNISDIDGFIAMILMSYDTDIDGILIIWILDCINNSIVAIKPLISVSYNMKYLWYIFTRNYYCYVVWYRYQWLYFHAVCYRYHWNYCYDTHAVWYRYRISMALLLLILMLYDTHFVWYRYYRNCWYIIMISYIIIRIVSEDLYKHLTDWQATFIDTPTRISSMVIALCLLLPSRAISMPHILVEVSVKVVCQSMTATELFPCYLFWWKYLWKWLVNPWRSQPAGTEMPPCYFHGASYTMNWLIHNELLILILVEFANKK